VIGPGGPAWWLSAALGVAAVAGSLLTFTVPAVLRGTAVMNGPARGTALVVLLAGVPALACSMLLAARAQGRKAHDDTHRETSRSDAVRCCGDVWPGTTGPSRLPGGDGTADPREGGRGTAEAGGEEG
jgi:hypothetical protein